MDADTMNRVLRAGENYCSYKRAEREAQATATQTTVYINAALSHLGLPTVTGTADTPAWDMRGLQTIAETDRERAASWKRVFEKGEKEGYFK